MRKANKNLEWLRVKFLRTASYPKSKCGISNNLKRSENYVLWKAVLVMMTTLTSEV